MLGQFLGRLLKVRRRYAKAEDGAAAVEFALVAFPFLMLLGVILETGVMMFTEYTLQASVQQAARLMRTGQAQGSAMTAALFKAEICKTASLIINCTGNVTVVSKSAATFAALQTSLGSSLNVGPAADGTPSAAAYSCGAPNQMVGVVATFDWNFIFPFMSFNSNLSTTTKKRLVGIALFANEPFPAGTTCVP
jgi:Flp pilus assembly protein TadG